MAGTPANRRVVRALAGPLLLAACGAPASLPDARLLPDAGEPTTDAAPDGPTSDAAAAGGVTVTLTGDAGLPLVGTAVRFARSDGSVVELVTDAAGMAADTIALAATVSAVMLAPGDTRQFPIAYAALDVPAGTHVSFGLPVAAAGGADATVNFAGALPSAGQVVTTCASSATPSGSASASTPACATSTPVGVLSADGTMLLGELPATQLVAGQTYDLVAPATLSLGFELLVRNVPARVVDAGAIVIGRHAGRPLHYASTTLTLGGGVASVASAFAPFGEAQELTVELVSDLGGRHTWTLPQVQTPSTDLDASGGAAMLPWVDGEAIYAGDTGAASWDSSDGADALVDGRIVYQLFADATATRQVSYAVLGAGPGTSLVLPPLPEAELVLGAALGTGTAALLDCVAGDYAALAADYLGAAAQSGGMPRGCDALRVSTYYLV
ncbi:MAG: hypothetical protein R2939_20335 [Kofleriaceae bacterium]